MSPMKSIKKIVKHKNLFTNKGEILLLTIISIGFVYFCFLIREIINPIVLFIILLFLFIPFFKYLWAKILLTITLFLFSLWVIQEAGYLVAPFIWAIFLSYMFEPFILKLEKKLPRLMAVCIIFIPLFITAIIFFIIIIPKIIGNIEIILNNLPEYVDKIYNSIVSLASIIIEKINKSLGKTIIDINIDYGTIQNYLFGNNGILTPLYKKYTEIKLDDISNIRTILSVIFSYFIILPFVTFYLMLDLKTIEQKAIKIIPTRWQEYTTKIIKKSTFIMNSYIKGMTILAISFFILSYILLKITKTEYAFILAILRGVLNYIPFIGPFMAFLIALFVSMLTDPIWWHGAIKMIIVYGFIQVIDSGLMAPKILGKSVQIHSLLVMLSTIIGGVLFGLIGVLFAVPFCGIILVISKDFFNRYYKSRFYNIK